MAERDKEDQAAGNKDKAAGRRQSDRLRHGRKKVPGHPSNSHDRTLRQPNEMRGRACDGVESRNPPWLAAINEQTERRNVPPWLAAKYEQADRRNASAWIAASSETRFRDSRQQLLPRERDDRRRRLRSRSPKLRRGRSVEDRNPPTEIILKSDQGYAEAASNAVWHPLAIPNDLAWKSRTAFPQPNTFDDRPSFHSSGRGASFHGNGRGPSFHDNGRGSGRGRFFMGRGFGRGGWEPTPRCPNEGLGRGRREPALELGGHLHGSFKTGNPFGARFSEHKQGLAQREGSKAKSEDIKQSEASVEKGQSVRSKVKGEDTSSHAVTTPENKQEGTDQAGINGSVTSSQTDEPCIPSSEERDEALRAKRRAQRVPSGSKRWYYVDPQGLTQGPCSIDQFHAWLASMSSDLSLAKEFKEFQEVSVWTEEMTRRVPILALMAMHPRH